MAMMLTLTTCCAPIPEADMVVMVMVVTVMVMVVTVMVMVVTVMVVVVVLMTDGNDIDAVDNLLRPHPPEADVANL